MQRKVAESPLEGQTDTTAVAGEPVDSTLPMSDYAARIRAARAYSGMTQRELADRIGVDVQTVKRREAGQQNPKRGELLAIAAVTGVPVAFMEHGFGDIEPSEVIERLQRIELALGTNEGDLAEVRGYARDVITALESGEDVREALPPDAPPAPDPDQAESPPPRARSPRRS